MIKVNCTKNGNEVECTIEMGGLGIEIVTELAYILAHVAVNLCKDETKDITVPLSILGDVVKISIDEIVELW